MASFNPYYKWLAIPPEEQPPNHYRLLGLLAFEADADVIEGAAERQTGYLRTFQTGPNSELAERLLNEVSSARVCLLDGKSKARYDQQLRAAQQPVLEDDPLAFTTEGLAAVSSKPATRSRQRSRGGKPVWKEPWAIPAGAGGIVILLLLLMMLFGSGEEPKDVRQGQEGEIASLTKKRVTAGNNKVVPTASDVAAKSGPAINEPPPAKAAVAPPLAVAPFDAAQAKAHQKGWSKYLRVPVEYTNSIGMKFMLIPAGEFTMGSNTFEDNEKPTHKVTLSQPFQLGMYEVTQEQYAKVVGTNPSKNKGSANPVEQVSWLDAVAFCKLLSDVPEEKATGYVYRLPTEAEWEHACRAGTTSDYSFGDGDSELSDYAWNSKNSGGTSHPVGGKQPSGFGLYDMHGNVREWCFNGLHAYPIDGSLEQQNLETTNPIRVQRGAGWNAPVDMARSSYRGRYLIHYRANDHGFRVVRLKTNSGSDLKASSLDMPQQPIRVDLLRRIHSIQGSLHQDWQKRADGTITANVKANHDITSAPVDELISKSPYGLVIDLGNVGRRTGKPRFSIKCPYNDTKRIIVNYYYGRTYNLSVGVEGGGSISTRQFLGYRSLTIHVTDQYVEASLNGQVFGRIAHERGDQSTKQENAKIEFSGISGSWMHFHIRSAKLLLNPPIDGL